MVECSSFTVDNVAAIMSIWAQGNSIDSFAYSNDDDDDDCLLPKSVMEAIKAMQQRSMNWCIQECARYFVTYHPSASWLYLASKMYLLGANSTAFEMINEYLKTKGNKCYIY